MIILKRLLTVLLIARVYCSFAQERPHFNKSDSIFVFNSKLDFRIKQKMIDSAFVNNSTAPNFVVIIATNKLTGVTKEVCTEAPFVIGGLDRNKGSAKSQKYNIQPLYFNTKSALENIGFDEYSYTELLNYGKRKEIRRIVSLVLKDNREQEYNFQGTRKEQFMFAHILFNNGIMSTRGDIAGNFMMLKRMK